MDWVRFSIDASMKYLSLVLRLLMAGRLESILLYFFLLISRLETKGNKERGVHETTIRVELWSKDNSFKL